MAVSFTLTAITVLVFLGPTTFVLAGNGEETTIPTLRLLALMPLAETAGLPNQSYYQVLDTAAQLAVDKINVSDDILAGYNLELVRANAETCNQRLVTEALGNFVRSVTDRDLNIVGVVGLLCSTVTQAVSPLAIPERPEIDLLQISAGATSPVFTNVKEYPRLYRMIPSSAVYNDAVLALMTEFQWRRISVVQDTTLVQHTTTADDFVRKVKGRSELNLVYLGDVTPTFPTSPIQSLVKKAARVIYASVTASEARGLLCESYWSGRRWPEFVWLFHDLSFEELMESTENCSNDTMVLEGVFFLQYRQPNSSTTLVSGQTYSEYYMELQEHIAGAEENRDANALHDSIWAFALALNNSRLEELESQGSKSNVTTDVERGLRTVNFSGALGDVVFNDKREVVTIVDIFHVINGSLMNTGHYNPLSENITVHLPPERIPRDDFEEQAIFISLSFTIVTFVVAILLFIFTTVILVCVIYYWNKPSIKATSPLLSLLILAGCYILYIGCFIAGVREYFDLMYLGPLCQAQLWFCTIGLELIYSALFMRLLRIYRIFFFVFEKPGKLWSNQSMVAFTFIPVAGLILVMALWSAVDPIFTQYLPPDFEPTAQPPHYRVTVFCNVHSDQLVVWLSVILYGVNGVTVLAVAVLATLTRKVHLDCFKDTKQVNAFVFSTVICICIWLPYLLVFANFVPIPEVAYVFSVFSFFVIPFLCKVFLFIPKIWAAKYEKRKRRRPVRKASDLSSYIGRKSSHFNRSPLQHTSPSSCPRATQLGHPQLEHTDTVVTCVSSLR